MSSTPALSVEVAPSQPQALSPEVFDLTESNQWNQNPEPAQNGTLQEWRAPPPQYQQISTTGNGASPPVYNPSLNGQSNVYQPNNMQQQPTTSYQRNGINNNVYAINGVRHPTNAVLPGMIRHPAYPPNYANGNYATIANGRYVRAQGWVPGAGKPVNGVKKQKRNRTAFTSQQMMELEQEYARTRYLDRNRRIELSETLNLNQRTIKIWFQNRRMKEKKDRAEESEEVSTSASSPDLSEMPILVHEQYPVTVSATASELYSRAGLYMEQYPIATQSTVPANLPQVPAQMPPQFIEYVPETTYEQVPLKQVHLQLQQYDNTYDNAVPDVLQSDSTTASAPSSLNEQTWDLSWIRSIQIEEEM